MKKPKDLCEIRLSEKDVIAAISAYLNAGSITENITVVKVKASRSKKYILIAEIK